MTLDLNLFREHDGGTPEASLIGMLRMVPVANAVLVNSTAGHAFEMDDIHKDAITHPNSIAVPVALNVGERLMGTHHKCVSGAQVLTAMAAGYEVACRVGALNAEGDPRNDDDGDPVGELPGAIGDKLEVAREVRRLIVDPQGQRLCGPVTRWLPLSSQSKA